MPILVVKVDGESVVSFLLREFALVSHCTRHVSSSGFKFAGHYTAVSKDKTENLEVTAENGAQFVISTFPSLQEAHSYKTRSPGHSQFVVLPSDLADVEASAGSIIVTLRLPRIENVREYIQENKKVFQPLFLSWVVGEEREPAEFATRGSAQVFMPETFSSRMCVNVDIPGVVVKDNFVSEGEEKRILASLDAVNWEVNLKRRVQHFGYKFKYSSRNIDPSGEGVAPIPEFLDFLQDRFIQMGLATTKADQLTVNEYLTGQGIGHHVDTHSAFKEAIFILSLNSHIGFEFRQKQTDERTTVREYFLRSRSLCVMSGEARYGWLHGITSRKTDIEPKTQTVVSRSRRISLTFRWLNWDSNFQCHVCEFPALCDTKNPSSLTLPTRLKQNDSK